MNFRLVYFKQQKKVYVSGAFSEISFTMDLTVKEPGFRLECPGLNFLPTLDEDPLKNYSIQMRLRLSNRDDYLILYSAKGKDNFLLGDKVIINEIKV